MAVKICVAMCTYSYGRGVESPDYLDFVADLGGQKLNYAAPMPEFRTVTNAVIHAYCLVREQTAAGNFHRSTGDRT